MVHCLLDLGANVNCLNYGGFTPYHLTYGRQNEQIRCQLYERTAQELRELPDSDSDSDMEDVELLEVDVSIPNKFKTSCDFYKQTLTDGCPSTPSDVR